MIGNDCQCPRNCFASCNTINKALARRDWEILIPAPTIIPASSASLWTPFSSGGRSLLNSSWKIVRCAEPFFSSSFSFAISVICFRYPYCYLISHCVFLQRSTLTSKIADMSARGPPIIWTTDSGRDRTIRIIQKLCLITQQYAVKTRTRS